MNGLLASLFGRKRLTLSLAGLIAALGLVAWSSMPRQEDPTIPARFAAVTCVYPGADAMAVERQITQPLEDALRSVREIDSLSSTSRANVSVIRVELRQDIYASSEAWEEIRLALEEAELDLPRGARRPELYTRFLDQETVVLAVTGSLDRQRLLQAAKTVQRDLRSVDGVADVLLKADPGQQVTIEYDDVGARHLGVSAAGLAAQLRAQSLDLPGGTLAVGGRATAIRTSDFDSPSDLERLEIRLPSGATVPLSSVASVRFGPIEPRVEYMRFNGMEAVGISVVPHQSIDVVKLGDKIEARIRSLQAKLLPLKLHVLNFQPDYVAGRLSELQRSLLQGIGIVALILLVTMGFRLGLVVSSVVPLVALASLAVFASAGGVLHQISTASLIIAIGMLVDNAIVVAENIQRRMDDGQSRLEAAISATRSLAVPLATATLTTIAALVPLLVARGKTADFTRSVPQLLMLTLAISYLCAVTVTPVLSILFLRVRRRSGGHIGRSATWAARLATRRPRLVIGTAFVLVGLSVYSARFLERSFFPESGRNQLVIEQIMPEGTHLDETDAAARKLEKMLIRHPRVEKVSTFVGRSAPKFYYNLPHRPQSPHFANLVVQTKTSTDVESLMADVRAFAARVLPAAVVVPRKLEQGPPVRAPVELRIQGEALSDLVAAAESVVVALRATPGALDVRHDQGLGVPVVRLTVDSGAAGRRGLTRQDVTMSVLGQTRGLPAGELRLGDDPVPIVVRARSGQHLPAERLLSLDVPSRAAGRIPLAQVASLDVKWKPAAIHRRHGTHEITVYAQLADGRTYGGVLKAFAQRFDRQQLPPGVRIEIGGAAASSRKANGSIINALPLGGLLLFFFLMVEFNSFRRVLLILVTVPLAVAGVIPGLLISGHPFNFMSLLGAVALIGVVVNNAIVLLEAIEVHRRERESVTTAVASAIRLRTRAIMLTTATTVAGLIPLTLSQSPLWPPMASTMIAGLLASTLLSLLVVPSLYIMLFKDQDSTPDRGASTAGLSVVATLGLISIPSTAYAFPLSEAMQAAARRPEIVADEAQADVAEAQADAQWRRGYLPSVATRAGLYGLDRELTLEFDAPVGSLPIAQQQGYALVVRVNQPLFDPGQLLGAGPAADRAAQGQRANARRRAQVKAMAAAEHFLDIKVLDARMEATDSFIQTLEAQARNLISAAREGRALRVDQLQVELALADAVLDRQRLETKRQVKLLLLARAMGKDDIAAPGRLDLDPTIPVLEPDRAFDSMARLDLVALTKNLEATDRRLDAVWWTLVPRLEANGQLIATNGLPLANDYVLQGSVDLVWQPFAAGTRFAQASAERATRRALENQLIEAKRGVKVEVRAAFLELEVARAELEVAKQGVEQATEILRLEQQRYEAGRIIMSELLEAQSRLRERRAQRSKAAIDIIRAKLRVQLAVGSLPI